jgi:hypothetical protein
MSAEIEKLARHMGARTAYYTTGEAETGAGLEFEEIDGGFPGLYDFARAIRAAALEEAAKVAEDEFDAYSCAGAIRALIDPPK